MTSRPRPRSPPANIRDRAPADRPGRPTPKATWCRVCAAGRDHRRRSAQARAAAAQMMPASRAGSLPVPPWRRRPGQGGMPVPTMAPTPSDQMRPAERAIQPVFGRQILVAGDRLSHIQFATTPSFTAFSALWAVSGRPTSRKFKSEARWPTTLPEAHSGRSGNPSPRPMERAANPRGAPTIWV